MSNDPPGQTHSETSMESARSIKRSRVFSQERIIYEIIRTQGGRADWQLWEIIYNNLFYASQFDQVTSAHRARIGLLWRSRKEGATIWHPVEDSGTRIVHPSSNKKTVIWRLKERYRDMTYDEWKRDFRNLAKGTNEPPEDEDDLG